MTKSIFKLLTFLTLGVMFLAGTVIGQAPSKPKAKPVGEIITTDNSTKIDGALTQRGSTVLNGSEIATGDATAFVNLNSGKGILSIAPGSQVKVTLEQSKIIAKVMKGSVTVRTPLASTVIAPDRIINSEPNNLYIVSVSDSGTTVGSMLKSVAVKAVDGTVQTVAAQVTGALAARSGGASATGPNSPAQVSEDEACAVSVSCRRDANTLSLTGRVMCASNPVGGTRVTLHCYFRNRQVGLPQVATTDRQGQYSFIVTNANVPQGGTVWVIAENCGGCASPQTSRGNRCSF